MLSLLFCAVLGRTLCGALQMPHSLGTAGLHVRLELPDVPIVAATPQFCEMMRSPCLCQKASGAFPSWRIYAATIQRKELYPCAPSSHFYFS